MTDDPGTLHVLTEDECLALLGRGDIGRIAFNTASGPQIYPVNYALVDGTIVIRTSPYAPLSEHASDLLAFEVDDVEPALRRGWSVLVVGQCAPVDDPDEAIRLRRTGKLEPWAAGQRNMFLRVTPHQISGRRIS